jgi:hypothetical protein
VHGDVVDDVGLIAGPDISTASGGSI